MPNSLFEYIAESIDEVLPPGSGMTGREIYLRGFERYEREGFEKRLAQERRELDKLFPLLASSEEVIKF